MKTRTLLLLALACGLAIMLAGAVFLVQLSGQADVEPPVPLGEIATAGDMTIVVDGADEAGGFLDVSVRIGGVDDDDGAAGFRLIASGRAVEPEAGASRACAGPPRSPSGRASCASTCPPPTARVGCCSTSAARAACGGCWGDALPTVVTCPERRYGGDRE